MGRFSSTEEKFNREMNSGMELRRIDVHPDEASGAVFAPDSRCVPASGIDGAARLAAEERVQFNISNQGPTCPAHKLA